jgi:hypothetical protein
VTIAAASIGRPGADRAERVAGDRLETGGIGHDAEPLECGDEALSVRLGQRAPLAAQRKLGDIRQIVRRDDQGLERSITVLDGRSRIARRFDETLLQRRDRRGGRVRPHGLRRDARRHDGSERCRGEQRE